MRCITPAYVLIAGCLLTHGANAETTVYPSVVYAVRGNTVHEVRGDDIALLERHSCLPHGGLKWNVLPLGNPVLCHGQWYTEVYLERLRDQANSVEEAETAAVSTGLDLWIYEPRAFRGRYRANLGYGRAMVGEIQLRNTFGGDLSVPGFGLRGGFVFHYAGSQQYRRGLLEVPTIEIPYVLSVGNWGAEIGLRSGLALLHDFEIFSTEVHERLSVIYGLYGVLAYRGAHSRGMREPCLATAAGSLRSLSETRSCRTPETNVLGGPRLP